MASVAILMCTYNGESFLAEQLGSFVRQTFPHWSLHVSDDGSQDGSLTLLNDFSGRHDGRVQIIDGPHKGFVANFLGLTCRDDIDADFYAWSDQDDVWKEEKLERALAWLQTVPSNVPALYCGRTELIHECGMSRGFSPLFRRPPHFSNALVQSIAGGNTVVFNQAARALLKEAGKGVDVPSHDWWLYQIVSGAGGTVFYDPEPMVLYRQHDENLMGTNSDWSARLQRIRMLFDGRFEDWNTRNIQALESMQHRLTKEHQATLAEFKAARTEKLVKRILGFQRAGLYRQTLLGSLGLIFATLLKKI